MFYNLFSNNILLLCCAFLSTFSISFLLIKNFIVLLKKHSKFQPIRDDGPENHLKKTKTPTMGGLAFGFSIILNILLFCDLSLQYTYVFLTIIASFMAIGLIDDVRKVFYNDTLGLKGSYKLILEMLIVTVCLLWTANINPNYLNEFIKIPFFNIFIDFKYFAFPLLLIAMVGSSNATNITDGLDGLLSVPVIIISTALIIIVSLILNNLGLNFNNFSFALEKELLYNIIILLVIIVSSFSAFLCFNLHPAKIFMGDVGSLMIGAILFFISFLLKIELYFAIMALLFIVELFSTFLQVFFYKITHKRIFKMAPIHHHFEKCGWLENKVVYSFWTFCLLSTIFSLFLLFF